MGCLSKILIVDDKLNNLIALKTISRYLDAELIDPVDDYSPLPAFLKKIMMLRKLDKIGFLLCAENLDEILDELEKEFSRNDDLAEMFI